MFTTQHYQVLAKEFNKSLKNVWESDKADGIQVYTILSLAKNLADTLYADNALFSYAPFYVAVCKDTPYSMTQLGSYRLSHDNGIKALENNLDSSLKDMAEKKCTCRGTLIPTFCSIHNPW